MTTLYTNAVAAASTTVFLNYNITAELLTQYNVGNIPANNLAFSVLRALCNSTGTSSEAHIYTMIWAGIREYFGFYPCVGVNCGRPWSGPYGHRADAATSYGGCVANQAPRLSSLLALDDWLVVRPIEWGIPGDNVTADFSKEITLVGGPATSGWFANKGSKDYAANTGNENPFRIVAYGPLAINVIAQACDCDFGLKVNQASWNFGGEANWYLPVAETTCSL